MTSLKHRSRGWRGSAALSAVGCVQETLRALVVRKEEEDGKDEDANAQLPGKIPGKNDHDGGGAEELL
ncbi:hypothetical protein GN244_ATG01792 [Phytophthora infestans]|uniref:Uncharacterized protein n=1 Tax=Phytophthora infestans TaxID=4787 RepID=A0A833T9T1_PHYIN|nr:hypothetical protein GN244_ATG01792 [Phytophthora infestans]KAF4136601.1 hypothetical protein GN958_ATG14276 [Phytophthora infestans]